MRRWSHTLPAGTSDEYTLAISTVTSVLSQPSVSHPQIHEGLSLLVQVQDGLQGGRAQTVPQHQKEVSALLSHKANVS